MNSADNHTEISNADTIDLVDLLLTLAENLRLLLLGPLLIGSVTFGVTYLLPQKFESVAILKAEPSAATYMTSASVLDAALKKLGHLKGLSEEEAEEARTKLQRQVSAHVGRNDRLITLKVEAGSPEASQRMANEILVHTFASLKPNGAELQRLSAEKAILSQQVSELTAASKTTQRILERASSTDNLGSVAESIAAISNNLIRAQEGLHKVEQKLQGLTADDLIQTPTLPRKPVASNKSLITVLVTLATGLILFVVVLIRHAWRTSSSVVQHQARLDALKRRYGIGR